MQRKVAYVVLKDGGKELYVEETFGILEENFMSKNESMIIHVKTPEGVKKEKFAKKDIEHIGQIF